MITAVDVHAEGEPGRVITAGLPNLQGATVFGKMQWMQENADDIRLKMLREPRGNPVLCCNAIVPPCHPDADMGFIIMEQTEYPPMSGSNTICTVTALLETGILPMVEPITTLTLEAPAGLVKITAACKNGKVTRVTFENVPAFVMHLDAHVELPGFGSAKIDIAWGGMIFAIADAAQFGLEIRPDTGRDQVRFGEMIRQAAFEQIPVVHPQNPAITGPTIGQLTGPASRADAHGKTSVTVSNGPLDWSKPNALTGALDRSPCGTGTCAKMAVLHARGQLDLHTDYVNEGPLGTTFTGRLNATTTVAGIPAVVPQISGQGWITGLANYVIDPTDPFQDGYTLGDIWA